MKVNYYSFEQVFEPGMRDKVSEILKERSYPEFEDKPDSNSVKICDVFGTYWKDCKEYLHEFEDLVHYINFRNFGFDIYKFSNLETVHYNVYNEKDKGKYDWHHDGYYGELFDTKLTALINLSPAPYEGGKFEVFINKPMHIEVFDNPGSAVIFPSYMQHRVTPVTRGKRITATMFFHGPMFR